MNDNHIQKTVLITGASRGIGAAAAERFARGNYRVYLTCDKTMDDLRALAFELSQKYHISCTPIRCDVGDINDVDRLFVQIISDCGALDVLINNAGISHVGLLHDMRPDEWQRVMNVNLNSLFYTCKNAIPLMLQNHSGHIINISSVWGNVGASMEVAYSAAKGGVNSFTKALARELAPSNIQVNAIACGIIDTAMNACFSSEDLETIRQEIPADRIGSPFEVAELIFQTAHAPSYMTGQIITIDGGWT